MYDNKYGLERQLITRYLGIDLATGKGQDFSTLVLVEKYEEKVKVSDFPEEFQTITKYMVVDLQRTRDLSLPMQIPWARSYIESLGLPRPIISCDGSRELAYCLQLRGELPHHTVNVVVWVSGSSIGRDGRQYNAGKTGTWRQVKAMIALGMLTRADLPLTGELEKEMANLTLDETENGEAKIKATQSGIHDDLAMGMSCALVPVLHRNILERVGPRSIPSILDFTGQVEK